MCLGSRQCAWDPGAVFGIQAVCSGSKQRAREQDPAAVPQQCQCDLGALPLAGKNWEELPVALLGDYSDPPVRQNWRYPVQQRNAEAELGMDRKGVGNMEQEVEWGVALGATAGAD